MSSSISVNKLRQRAFPAYVQDVLTHIGNVVQSESSNSVDKLFPLVSEFVLHTTVTPSQAQGRSLTSVQELQLVNLLSTQFNKWYDNPTHVSRGYKVFSVLFGSICCNKTVLHSTKTATVRGKFNLSISANVHSDKVLCLLTQLLSLAISLQHGAVLHYAAVCFINGSGGSDLSSWSMVHVCEELVRDFCIGLSLPSPLSTISSFGNLDALISHSESFTCLFTTVVTSHLYNVNHIIKDGNPSVPSAVMKLVDLFNSWLSVSPGLCFTNVWPMIHSLQQQAGGQEEEQDWDDPGSGSGVRVPLTPIPGLMEWCLVLPHMAQMPSSSLSHLHLHLLHSMCSYPDLNLPDDLLRENKVTLTQLQAGGAGAGASLGEEGELDKPYYLSWSDLIRLIKLVSRIEGKYDHSISIDTDPNMINATWERLVQFIQVTMATGALRHSDDNVKRAKLLLPQTVRDLLELQHSS